MSLGLAMGLSYGRPPSGVADPLAGYSWAVRLQTHRGDNVPLGLYQDVLCTTPATADGQSVAAWRDEISGSGLIASQSNSMQRPTLRFRSGVPVLAFDGVDDSLTFASLASNTIKTIFTGQKSTDITAFRAIVDDLNVQCYVGQNNAGKGVVIDSIGAIWSAANLTTNAEVWTAYYFAGAPGELHLRMAGVDTLLVTDGTFGSAGSMRIGRAGNDSAAWQGDISAVLLSTVSFAVPDIEVGESYLEGLLP